jgi:hypothetical protein
MPCKSIHVVSLFFIVSLMCQLAIAQQATAPIPAEGTLDAELTSDVKPIMQAGPCKSWPPSGVDLKDAKRRIDGKNPKDLTADFAKALAADLRLHDNPMVFNFASSPTRLFDTPVTQISELSSSIGVDKDQLGLARILAPTALYDTDSIIVKYDCLTLTELTAKSNPNYAISFFTLDAALQADQDKNSKQTITFVRAKLQSPFSLVTKGRLKDPAPSQVLFANLMALSWILDNPTKNTYLESADVLAVTSTDDNTESQNLLGDLRSGINLAVVSSSGEAKGQITNAMEQHASSFRTFYWNGQAGNFPAAASLASSIGPLMVAVPLKPDTTDLTDHQHIVATGSVTGWPRQLCGDFWDVHAMNSRFSTQGVDLVSDYTEPTPGSLPVCNITVDLAFDKLNPGESPTPSLIGSPELQLVLKRDSSITFPLRLQSPFHYHGQPGSIAHLSQAAWRLTPPNGIPTSLDWPLHVQILYSDETFAQNEVDLLPTDFQCKGASFSKNFSDVKFANPTDASGWKLSTASPAFDLVLTLNPAVGGPFETDVSQAAKLSCTIVGQVTARGTVGGNAVKFVAPVSTTDAIYYPGSKQVTTPASGQQPSTTIPPPSTGSAE